MEKGKVLIFGNPLFLPPKPLDEICPGIFVFCPEPGLFYFIKFGYNMINE